MDDAVTGIVGGSELALDSDGFFELEQQPRKVAVIGGGYIATETAGMLAAMGSEVHHFMRQDRALKKFDGLLSETVHREHQKMGIRQWTHVRVEEIVEEGNNKRSIKFRQAEIQDGVKISRTATGYDCVILAAGRLPRTTGLNLEKAGVNVRTGGAIEVDAKQATNVKGIYALGDVIGKVDLTPVAIATGRKLAERLFHHRPDAQQSYEAVPSVIFSHPPIGTVGLTEKQACQDFGDAHVKVYESDFVDLFYGLYTKHPPKPEDKAPHISTRTFIKVVCVGPHERVAGVHIVGRSADEILQGFAVCVRAGLTKTQLDDCVAIHPTAGEELVTLAKCRPGRAD